MKHPNAQPTPASDLQGSLLDIVGVEKSFSGVRVLNQVSVQVRAGEVHAFMGENGAGKSTLMKILAGLYAPDSGHVKLNGSRVEPGNTHAALRAGIAMIYQELLPFPDLSVAENIYMGQEPLSRFPGWIDRAEIRRKAKAVLGRLGIEIRPQCLMRELRVAEMQMVEIAKALVHQAKLIIMDEPTSALSDHEAEALFRMIEDLRRQGTTILYISHKLEEVFRLSDRVTVLRDGSLVGTYPVGDLTRERLIGLMVGRALEEPYPNTLAGQGQVAIAVSGLCKRGRFRNICFEVHRGEILGLAGLMGAGRTNVVNAIYGLEPADSGEIIVSGLPARIRNTRDAIRAGIGLVTEDRKTFGFVPTLDVQQNLSLAALPQWCRAGFINHSAEARMAVEQMRTFAIRAAGRHQPVNRLSGGNQQKVVLARTLLAQPEVLLLDEPTRGIDIAAKVEVHALISRLAQGGKAVVLVSSELPELLALSHRIIVMRQGEITAELDPRRAAPEEVLRAAMPQ